MATDLTPPDPSVVLDLIEAFRRSKVLFTAVRLGVFDALAAGPKSCAALAAELPANADALERLLDACVGLGLLDRRPEYSQRNGQSRLPTELPCWSDHHDSIKRTSDFEIQL